ncbi:hypothetical protein BGZ80_010170 [Entomortierella chlamydospora]|uniref:UDENN domain-containing protein n=1 Tax=Entomortierella chlamydospora TaxID=101097 RepID=A0A9P6MV93_9FUNG|nr:hypothetical protein BGZ80_010170 [Entomortierella chlamydospora]
MATWRPPTTEGLMELPFMGTLYQVQLAKPHQPQLLETSPFDIATYQPDTHILSSVPMDGGLYKHFQDLVPDLWLCWELMTLAEPIMLIGTSPEIPYCGDYRPYFTIQDTDFKSFCNKSSPPSSIILGVTNPFFAKSLEHWPHIIKIGKPMNRRPNNKLMNDGSIGKTTGSPRQGKPTSLDFVQYFATLTEKFLVPLNRYFATLVPNDISLSSTSQFPHIAPFKQQTFLKFLSKNPPAISFKTSTFKSNSEACQSFYKDFLKCGNFATWLRLRTIAAQNELRRRYLEILSLGDVAGWVKGRNEVEVVDLLVRMREELGSSGNKGDLFSLKPKPKTRPGLSREGSDPLVELGSAWSRDLTNGHRRYADERQYSGNGIGSGSGSGSDVESRTITPPLDPSIGGRQISLPSTPNGVNGSNGLTGPRTIPSRRLPEAGGIYSTASSFSSNSSRTATPSRSSSSSSLNAGWAENKDREEGGEPRESSPERQRQRYAPEASAIKATLKQKEQLRDQIRLLIEALPVDLRESLKANEAKKRAAAGASHEVY